MKKNLSLILFILFFLAAGCKKSTTEDVTSTEITPVRSALLKGQWKVSYFVSNGSDKTFDYKEFKFTFYSNGLVTGANDILSENGSWSLVSDSAKTKLNIDFSSATLLVELTADWEIVSRSATAIVMQDISGGSGGQTDYLTIVRV